MLRKLKIVSIASRRAETTDELCNTKTSDPRTTWYANIFATALKSKLKSSPYQILLNTNPILDDFSPALNIPSRKVTELVGVKCLLENMSKFLFFFNIGLWLAVIELSSPLGFPRDVNCVFFARTLTASGGRTFGACNSNLNPEVMAPLKYNLFSFLFQGYEIVRKKTLQDLNIERMARNGFLIRRMPRPR